jgi:hypothetical protein
MGGVSVPVGVFVAWLMAAGVFGALFFGALPRLDPEKSPRPIARAAVAAAGPGRPVGLYRQATLRGGLLHYGAPAVVVLESDADVARFLARGGRVWVVRARDLDRLTRSTGELRIVSRLRSGGRTQLVVDRDRPGPAGAERGGAIGDGAR